MTLESIEDMRNTVQTIAADCDEGWILGCLDAVEREIERDYMKLPVDADGVPIHVGDTLEFTTKGHSGIVKALNEHMVIAMHTDSDYTNYAKYGLLWDSNSCRHVKPRTLEDILGDYVEAWDSKAITERDAQEITAKYADEIRELMGGDAE